MRIQQRLSRFLGGNRDDANQAPAQPAAAPDAAADGATADLSVQRSDSFTAVPVSSASHEPFADGEAAAGPTHNEDLPPPGTLTPAAARVLPHRVAIHRVDQQLWEKAACKYVYLRRPEGEINVMDVLLQVFLFLPLDMRTLVAVGHTCHAWRDASEYLPQWSLLPQLCDPPGNAWDRKEPGYAVDRRWDLMECLENRRQLMRELHHAASRREQERLAQEQNLLLHGRAQLAACGEIACRAAVRCAGVVIGTAVMVVLLACAYGIGVSALMDSSGDADAKIAASAFFGCLGVACAGLVALTVLHHATEGSQAAVPVASGVVFIVAAAFSGVPLALISARFETMDALASAPRVVVSSDPSQCQVATPGAHPGVPRVVQLEALAEWRVEPWIGDRPTNQVLPLSPTCRGGTAALSPAANRSASWASWFESAGSSSEQCWDAWPTGGGWNASYVLLYPPAWLARRCPSPPVAVLFRPFTTVFNDTLAGLVDTSAAQRANVTDEPPATRAFTTLRTPFATGWFSVPQDTIAAGRTWFQNNTQSAPSTATASNATAAATSAPSPPSLWATDGIPLAVLEPVANVDEYRAFWLTRFWWTAGISVFVYVFVACFGALIEAGGEDKSLELYIRVILFGGILLFIEPVLPIYFGWACSTDERYNPDLCLMSIVTGRALFVIGLILLTVELFCMCLIMLSVAGKR
jgi:hypothetical protein